MPTTTVRWVHEKQFVGTDSHGQSIVLNGDETSGGVRPSQVLLIALGACSSVDVVEILLKKRMPLELLEVTVTGDQEEEPPWPFHKIHLAFLLKGKGLTEKAASQAIQLSEEKYCSVAATVRGKAEITTSFEIL
jgi:putative redox protein